MHRDCKIKNAFLHKPYFLTQILRPTFGVCVLSVEAQCLNTCPEWPLSLRPFKVLQWPPCSTPWLLRRSPSHSEPLAIPIRIRSDWEKTANTRSAKRPRKWLHRSCYQRRHDRFSRDSSSQGQATQRTCWSLGGGVLYSKTGQRTGNPTPEVGSTPLTAHILRIELTLIRYIWDFEPWTIDHVL